MRRLLRATAFGAGPRQTAYHAAGALGRSGVRVSRPGARATGRVTSIRLTAERSWGKAVTGARRSYNRLFGAALQSPVPYQLPRRDAIVNKNTVVDASHFERGRKLLPAQQKRRTPGCFAR